MNVRIYTVALLIAVVQVSRFTLHAAEPHNLILNGSFENPVGTTNSMVDTTPVSWTTETVIRLANGDVARTWGDSWVIPLPQDGSQYVTFNGTTYALTNGISQTIVVTNSENHLLNWFDSFALLRGGNQTGAWYSVTLHTESLQLVAQTNFNALHTGWKSRSMNLMLTGGTYVVRFAGIPGNQPPLLDNVSLIEQPEDLLPEIRTFGIEIRWVGRTNQMYQVQFQNVAEGSWSNLGEPSLGNGANAFADPIANNERRFYRVIRVP